MVTISYRYSVNNKDKHRLIKGMERYKKRDYDHTDESEVFKYKSLMASKNRKRMSKILFVALCIIAVLIIAACIISYFFNYM